MKKRTTANAYCWLVNDYVEQQSPKFKVSYEFDSKRKVESMVRETILFFTIDWEYYDNED